MYLFVYGTLRLRAERPPEVDLAMRRYAVFCRETRVLGRLYLIHSYPGFTASKKGDEWMRGELYKTRDSALLFDILDRYEGCSESDPEPHEYRRIELTISNGNGAAVNAWVYEYIGDLTGCQRIDSGDFLDLNKLEE